MLKTFLLLAHLNGNVYVLDYNLTAEDCAAQFNTVTKITLSDSEAVSLDNLPRNEFLSCQEGTVE